MSSVNKIRHKLKQDRWVYIGLLGVIILGAFLRMYHFSDNIFFEIDQARDYRIVHNILEYGIGEFPLVGPKAQKTFFRLGPFFYVPSMVSSWIWGLSPFSMAFPDVLFSILTIPLFYFFLREFFSKNIALSITSIFSVSLFAVEYAHFAWNPNSVPFFMLAAFYALLRYSRSDKNKVFWIVLLAIAMSISMQLHTITFISMPLIIVLYLIFSKTKVYLKQFFVFIAVSLFLFMPLIFNDILTKGENTNEFFISIFERNNSSEKTTVPKQVFMNVYNFTQFYTTILLSNDYVNKPIRLENSQNLNELINKNLSNTILRNNILKASIISLFLVITLGFFLKIYITKKQKGYFEVNSEKYRFIILVFIWQVIVFFLFYPLALKVDSRYFLVVLFIPFVLLGFIFNLINIYIVKHRKIIIVAMTLILFILNFYQSFRWIKLVNSYSERNFETDEIILESYFLVTSSQWMDIVEYINSKFNENKFSNIYIKAHPFHVKSILYLLQINEGLPVEEIILEDLDAGGLYFVLRETDRIDNKGKMSKKLERYFYVVDETNFGTVTLFQLKLKNKNKFTVKDIIDIGYEQKINRCYMLDLGIEERDKCRIKDIKYIFE